MKIKIMIGINNTWIYNIRILIIMIKIKEIVFFHQYIFFNN